MRRLQIIGQGRDGGTRRWRTKTWLGLPSVHVSLAQSAPLEQVIGLAEPGWLSPRRPLFTRAQSERLEHSRAVGRVLSTAVVVFVVVSLFCSRPPTSPSHNVLPILIRRRCFGFQLCCCDEDRRKWRCQFRFRAHQASAVPVSARCAFKSTFLTRQHLKNLILCPNKLSSFRRKSIIVQAAPTFIFHASRNIHTNWVRAVSKI